MRCRRLIAVLLAAVFLLSAVVPAVAEDGRRRIFLEDKLRDHPWQDDTSDGDKPTKKLVGIAIGPITFTINIAIPIAQKPTQALTSKSKPTTSKSVEKGK